MSESSLPLLIAAMEMEVRPLIQKMKRINLEGAKVYDGNVDGQNLRVLISGIGGSAALDAASLAASMTPLFVLNLGFAGGLKPELNHGGCFIPAKICNRGGEWFPCNPFEEEARMDGYGRGILLTSSTIVQSAEEKKSLSFLGDAVDMEAFFLASILVPRKIPFFCAKVISDTVEESLPLDFSPAIRNGKVLTGKAVSLMMKNPDKIFPVLKLARRSREISESLSRLAYALLSMIKNRA